MHWCRSTHHTACLWHCPPRLHLYAGALVAYSSVVRPSQIRWTRLMHYKNLTARAALAPCLQLTLSHSVYLVPESCDSFPLLTWIKSRKWRLAILWMLARTLADWGWLSPLRGCVRGVFLQTIALLLKPYCWTHPKGIRSVRFVVWWESFLNTLMLLPRLAPLGRPLIVGLIGVLVHCWCEGPWWSACAYS
jgi:hypothetical protein